MLAAYGITRLVSSTSTRCLTTLLPYAHQQEILIESYSQLTEEVGADDPKGVAKLIAKIRDRDSGDRPADRDLRAPAGAAAHPGRPGDGPGQLVTGEFLVAHLTDEGEVHALERQRPQA